MPSIGALRNHINHFTLPNMQQLGEAESRGLDSQSINNLKRIVHDDLKRIIGRLETDSIYGALEHDKTELFLFLRKASLALEWKPNRMISNVINNIYKNIQFLSIMCPEVTGKVNRLRNYL